MVAAVLGWHEYHHRAADEIERRLDRGEVMLAAAPALVESYAVLTRLPPPHRLSAADALMLVEANFIEGATIIALDGAAYRALLRRAPTEGIVGGRTYAAVIGACCLSGGATTLLTFNERHFRHLTADGVAVVVP